MSGKRNYPLRPVFSRLSGLLNLYKKSIVGIRGALNKAKMAWFSAGYFLHLYIRYLHDRTYEKVPVYKNYTDKKYTSQVHKIVLVGFIASFVIFTIAQGLFPGIFGLKPTVVKAGSYSVSWTSLADFTNNNGSTSAIIKSNVDLSTSQGDIRLSSLYGTGQDGDATVGGTVTIQALYENDVVTGVTTFRGSNKGLNKGVGTYNPSTGAVPNFANLSISASGKLTTTGPSGANPGVKIEIKVSNALSIAAAGSIDAKGMGYGAAFGPGAGPTGVNGFGGGGGSYGGAGGSRWATPIGATYSYATNQFGSGGGNTSTSGGNGGGAIKLLTNIFNNQGTVIADGNIGTAGSYAGPGGGSGGSIYIDVQDFQNVGNLSSNGGAGANDLLHVNAPGGGGGGGRIKVLTSLASVSGSVGGGAGGTGGYASTPTNYAGAANLAGVEKSAINTAVYDYPGNLGSPNAGSVGLRFDSGQQSSVKFSSLDWTGDTPSSGQKILFKVRSGNTQAELDSSLCYGPTESDTGCADWSSAGKFFSQVNASGVTTRNPATLPRGILSSIPVKRYAEVLIYLTSDGSGSPILSDVTLSYDALESPLSANTTMYRTDGTTKLRDASSTELLAGQVGTSGAYTSENSFKVGVTGLTCGYTPDDNPTGSKYCGGGANSGVSTARKVQIQAAPTTDTAFSNMGTLLSSVDSSTTTTTSDGGGQYSSLATISGLTVNTPYHLRLRTIDAEGRVSDWTSYGSNLESSPDITVEQSAPDGTVVINDGAQFATSTSVTLTSTATDTGGSEADGIPQQMRFSNTGSFDPNGADWEAFNATRLNWALPAGDDTKVVYAQYRDNAGNIGGKVFSSTADWNAANPSSLDTTSDDIKITKLAASGTMYLLWDGGTAPSGWTIDTTFNGKMIKGGSVFGQTGGSDTHTHTAGSSSVSGSGTSNARGYTAGYFGCVSVGGVTHTVASSTIGPASSLPSYRNLAVIKYNSGIPTTIPAGAIAFFDGNVSGSWSSYSLENNYYVRIDSTAVGTTGGTNNHDHTITGSTSTDDSGGVGRCPGSSMTTILSHGHNFSGSTGGESSLPPTTQLILAKASVDTVAPAGMVGMFESLTGSEWSANLYQGSYIQGSSSYLANTGNTLHGHSSSMQTPAITTPSMAVDAASGPLYATTTSGHTHSVDLSLAETALNPSYKTVIFGKRNTPYLTSGTLGVSGAGLRYGDPTGVAKKWSSLGWSADGLTSTHKIGIKVRTGDTWGAGDTGFVNPSDGADSYYYITSGLGGTIPLLNTFASSKTIEVRLEVVGDGTNTAVLHDLSVQAAIPASITLDTTAPVNATGTITRPVGAESFVGATVEEITWDSTKITDAGSGLAASPITIKYTQNNGSNWTNVATGEANDGVYSWNKVPNISCVSTCKVAILATDAIGKASVVTDANTVSEPFSIISDTQAPIWDPATLLDVSNTKYVNGVTTWTDATPTLFWDPTPTDPQPGSGVKSYEVIFEGGTHSTMTNLTTAEATPTLSEGPHTWYVNAIDGADLAVNTKDELSLENTITVDATAPTATINLVSLTGTAATNSCTISVNLTDQVEAGSGIKAIQYSNDQIIWSDLGAGSSWDLCSADSSKGTKNVYARLIDNVNNQTILSDTILFEDTKPQNPTSVLVSLVSNQPSDYNGSAWVGASSVTVAWSGQTDPAPNSSGISSFLVHRSVDDGSYIALSTDDASPFVDSGLVDGHNYKYLIEVVDSAGNRSLYGTGQAPGDVTLADITNPVTPPSFSAIGTDSTTIEVSWNSALENSTSHSGKANSYTLSRTAALGGTEPGAENGSCSTNTYSTTVGSYIFEQGGVYNSGSDKYTVSNAVTAEQWYYYRVRATDENSHTSTYSCYKARGNFAPDFLEGDISLSVNNGHTTETVAPGDVVTASFKVTDADGRVDLDSGNAAQRVRIQNGTLAEVLPYTVVSSKANYTASLKDGYIYTYIYTVPSNANYGTYTATIHVADSVAVGSPGENAHNQTKQVQFKVPPQAPTSLSAMGNSSTTVNLSWTPPANGGLRTSNTYSIERKPALITNDGAYTEITQVTATSYQNTALTMDTGYDYRVRAIDVSGNFGTYSVKANVTTPTPALPPVATFNMIDASTVESSENRFLLVWDEPVASITDNTTLAAFSKYVVEKSTDGGVAYTQTFETNNRYLVEVGLSNTVDYSYRIRVKDTYNNLSRVDLSPVKAGKPGAKPTVNITTESTSTSSANIKWTATQEAETQVVYDTDQNKVNDTTSKTNTAGVGGRRSAGAEHNVTITGLVPNTTYYYKIVSRNVLGFANDVDVRSFKTKNFVIEHTKGADVTTTTGTAVLRWKTGEVSSDSFVEYQMQAAGENTGSSQTAGSSAMVSAGDYHTVNIIGLKPGTRYSYKLRSMDAGKFVVDSSLDYFETKAYDSAQFTIEPTANEVAEQNITATSAKIVWNTAIPTTSEVIYGVLESNLNMSVKDAKLNTIHVVELLNLTPGTTYYYQVVGVDSGGTEYSSKKYKFSAILQPEIKNLNVKVTSSYTATVTFDTNVDTDGVVTYGKNRSYNLKAGNTQEMRNHSIDLKDLEDDSSYDFYVEVKDRTGSVKRSGESSFKTPIDRTGPVIKNSKIDIMPLGDSDATATAIITWQTDKPSTTKIEYDEGVIGSRYTKASIEDPSLGSTHTVIVKELAIATTYHYRIVTTDKRGNTTTSGAYNFVTPTKEQSVWQLIVKSLQETFAWTKNVGNIFKRK